MSAQSYRPSWMNPSSGNVISFPDFSGPGWNSDPDAIASYTQAYADSLGGKIGDLFGEGNSSAAALAKTQSDRAYEQAATQSARAWDEYMQSTQFQRMTKDLEAAGLNPWLALQGASLTGSHQTSAGSGSSARYKSEESKKSGAGTVLAALLIACARIAAAVIAA